VGQQLQENDFQEWVENNRALLAGNDISFVVTGFSRWELPSPLELHRLGRISEYRIPDVFGPSETEQAVSEFAGGNPQGCMETFTRMLADKEHSGIRNNLAFCQILTGDAAAGLENLTKAIATDYEPLYEMNKAIAEYLVGNIVLAKASFRKALEQLHTTGSKYDSDASYVLVLEPDGKTVVSHADLPVDAAILINLWRVGE
jgi:hypothetical protein